ncbi:CaiB/BaiF CoA transferase family protein [Pseudoponticoccus marisrubri]|uniref:Acyl-CoA transferase n=1 Tax=Pseudoponticoccus marisrubri TaxID=1685382 RepID=A0A0W7WGZ6_9RHOB|nr:CaiB/BaiF CoA-transferase family protein [Pseudoponticoccus marisrubri]KUF09904.1 acyl-CoA transferase [Pseudoponticoccus marisrubri]
MPVTADTPGLLDGLTVLDFSQFLSGPFAALRLGDLGARVIKVERAGGGDLCRGMYLTPTDDMGRDSTLFHTINRGKESFAVDLKDPDGLAQVRALIAGADVLIQNFRPGVIDRLGLGQRAVAEINPRLVYCSITGFGTEGPWVARPGQDLLAQARSGLMFLNGDEGQGPLPFGLAIADVLAGTAIVQGALAALVRRGRTGQGGHVETSLLDCLIDFQFEVLTTYLNDGGRLPERAGYRNAHAYLSAPYGIYPTADGYLALAMTPLDRLAPLLDPLELAGLGDSAPFRRRDELKRRIAAQLSERATEAWLAVLEPEDIWCAGVLDWDSLLREEAFRRLDMLQELPRPEGDAMHTLRAPIRVDGARPRGRAAGPALGQHTEAIRQEFGL